MDAVRLLSRGVSARSKQRASQHQVIPSAEQARPQLFGDDRPAKKRRIEHSDGSVKRIELSQDGMSTNEDEISFSRPPDERKAVLRQHKIKATWFKPSKGKKSKSAASGLMKPAKTAIFPDPLVDFGELASRCGIAQKIANNVTNEGYREATEVQMAAIPLLCTLSDVLGEEGIPAFSKRASSPNLLTVAPTGSGKTLAFLIPTLSGIFSQTTDRRTMSALILAPTRELADQIVNEGRTIAQGTGLKVTAYRKDMRLADGDTTESDSRTVSRPDVLVSTPGMLQSAIDSDASPFADIKYLILDEADVLLDPLFRAQTTTIWQGLSNPELRVSLWSATIGSNIEQLSQDIIKEHEDTRGAQTRAPFIRLVIGLKDSALPNVEHKLIYAASEQGKLMALRQLLHPTTSSADDAVSLRPPFIVFTQTIERAVALHAELLYDIPVEAGGIKRIAVLHSDLSDAARSEIMNRFRKGEIWVLITTDLLSRGIDFKGINGVVNYDIPNSSAAYVHRAGRTGRAGREGGIAVTLYSKDDIPYLKQIANVIAAAQKEGGHKDAGIQQWLLDALPTLSKNEKQSFKKHGVEVRTAKGASKDAKAAREARISTKAGFIRRTENNRRGAIEASRRRKAQAAQMSDDEGFSGFD